MAARKGGRGAVRVNANEMCPVTLQQDCASEQHRQKHYSCFGLLTGHMYAEKAAGAEAVRLHAYETRPGTLQHDCIPEQQMLAEGSIHALAFTSTAEVKSSLRQILHPHMFTQYTGTAGFTITL